MTVYTQFLALKCSKYSYCWKWGWEWEGIEMIPLECGNPQRTRSYFSGFLRLCQFGWKSIKKCDRESACRRTDTHTDRHTDANRFYNLSHAICYSYGTDNDDTLLL